MDFLFMSQYNHFKYGVCVCFQCVEGGFLISLDNLLQLMAESQLYKITM